MSSSKHYQRTTGDSDSAQLLSAIERKRKKSNRKIVCLFVVSAVAVATVTAIATAVGVTLSVQRSRLPNDPYERAIALLNSHPLIDG